MIKTLLEQMTELTTSEYWNDSCSIDELTDAIINGASGATTNPVIVHAALKKEMHIWKACIHKLIQENPTWNEDTITTRLIEIIITEAARKLFPIFELTSGKKGWICIQVDPRNYRDTNAMIEQAVYLSTLAPNIQLKIPATNAGIPAMEEATYRGVNVAATVCFSVSQAMAVAEAIERALQRRKSQGLDTQRLHPACAVMVGRLDDWLKVDKLEDLSTSDIANLDYSGIAVVKKLHGMFSLHNFKTRLLVAAYRNTMHWTHLIGGDVIHTVPYSWQILLNDLDFSIEETIATPVPEKILDELIEKFPDFRRAYELDGLSQEEFDSFGATRKTLRQFIMHFTQMIEIVRDLMIPDSEVLQK